MTLCTANNCTRAAVARRLCGMHWKVWRAHGDANYQKPGFWSQVLVVDPGRCWLWTGATGGTGKLTYGRAWFQGKHAGAHRVAWILTNGPISKVDGADGRGTCVLHKCDVPLCCNPAHLYLGSHKRNMRDATERMRTNRFRKFCRHGHPRTPDNLYVSSKGLRACRTCHRLREANRQSRIRAHKEQRTSSF
jgi:hypothetical protein